MSKRQSAGEKQAETQSDESMGARQKRLAAPVPDWDKGYISRIAAAQMDCERRDQELAEARALARECLGLCRDAREALTNLLRITPPVEANGQRNMFPNGKAPVIESDDADGKGRRHDGAVTAKDAIESLGLSDKGTAALSWLNNVGELATQIETCDGRGEKWRTYLKLSSKDAEKVVAALVGAGLLPKRFAGDGE